MIPAVKCYTVNTKTRSFIVEWLRDKSDKITDHTAIRADYPYICDTFRFRTIRDYLDFRKTAFFKKNRYGSGAAYHYFGRGSGCQNSEYPEKEMMAKRIRERRITPYPE